MLDFGFLCFGLPSGVCCENELRKLLSHKISNGDVVAVLREAIQCAIQKHGKRKGAVEPARKPKSPRPPTPRSGPAARDTIPAEVKRQGLGKGPGPLRLDRPGRPALWQHLHARVRPHRTAALGGASTVDNVRVACCLCRSRHNAHYADRPLMPT